MYITSRLSPLIFDQALSSAGAFETPSTHHHKLTKPSESSRGRASTFTN